MTQPDFDLRYAEAGYAYGSEPNDFLAEHVAAIPPGPVLCLAEGQGRNAVFLASRGHSVVAVDRSAVGLARARELARMRGVSITCVACDLDDYPIAPGEWAGVVAIFTHLPVELRRRVFAAAVAGLRPGGTFLLEAYSPAQLAFTTGGPREPSLLMTAEVLREELDGLTFEVLREVERDVVEGKYHTGRAAVVQVLGRKLYAAP